MRCTVAQRLQIELTRDVLYPQNGRLLSLGGQKVLLQTPNQGMIMVSCTTLRLLNFNRASLG